MGPDNTCHLIITRYETGRYGTFGWAEFSPQSQADDPNLRGLRWATLEPPIDVGLAGEHAAIRHGEYYALPHVSPKFGHTWWLQNTEPDTEIIFHVGNWWRKPDGRLETKGCILLGDRRESLRGIPGVANSLISVRQFLSALKPYRKLHILIQEKFPTSDSQSREG